MNETQRHPPETGGANSDYFDDGERMYILRFSTIDLAAPSLDANEGMSEVIGVDGGVEALPLFKSEEKML